MLAFEPKEPDIMNRPPRDPDQPILTLDIMLRITTVGIILLIGAFGSFQWAIANVNMSPDAARTVAVNVFVVVEIFYLYNCRSLTQSVWRVGLFSNQWLTLGVVTMIVLQLAFTYIPFMNVAFHSEPIGLDAWWRIVLTGVAAYVIVEVEKWIRRILERRQAKG
jgi:Ca2+-transporting ATPase